MLAVRVGAVAVGIRPQRLRAADAFAVLLLTLSNTAAATATAATIAAAAVTTLGPAGAVLDVDAAHADPATLEYGTDAGTTTSSGTAPSSTALRSCP